MFHSLHCQSKDYEVKVRILRWMEKSTKMWPMWQVPKVMWLRVSDTPNLGFCVSLN